MCPHHVQGCAGWRGLVLQNERWRDAFTPVLQPCPGTASSRGQAGCGSSADAFLAGRACYADAFDSREGRTQLYLFSTRLA